VSTSIQSGVTTPIQPGREQGQEWAREELAKPEYARSRPGLFQRAVDWVWDQLDRIAQATGLGAGQLLTVILVVGVVVVVVIVLVRRNVRLSVATQTRSGAVLGDSTATGAEHRRRAAAALAEGRLDEAVRESMRAIARRLDERALLDPRPGRTADEIASAAGRLFPDLAGSLRVGAQTFDDVTYGAVRASLAQAEQLRRLDEQVEAARPVVLAGYPGAL
jgi:hypothetical protein